MNILNLSRTALFGLRYTTNLVYTAFSFFVISLFFMNLVVCVMTNLSASADIAGFHTDYVAGSWMRCRYSNCFPVVGNVIAFILFSNTSITCINALISTSPVSLSIIELRGKGGIFSLVCGSSNWVLVSIVVTSAEACGECVSSVGFLCTCWITLLGEYLCVARPSGRL